MGLVKAPGASSLGAVQNHKWLDTGWWRCWMDSTALPSEDRLYFLRVRSSQSLGISSPYD